MVYCVHICQNILNYTHCLHLIVFKFCLNKADLSHTLMPTSYCRPTEWKSLGYFQRVAWLKPVFWYGVSCCLSTCAFIYLCWFLLRKRLGPQNGSWASLQLRLSLTFTPQGVQGLGPREGATKRSALGRVHPGVPLLLVTGPASLPALWRDIPPGAQHHPCQPCLPASMSISPSVLSPLKEWFSPLVAHGIFGELCESPLPHSHPQRFRSNWSRGGAWASGMLKFPQVILSLQSRLLSHVCLSKSPGEAFTSLVPGCHS